MDNETHFARGLLAVLIVVVMVAPGVVGTGEIEWSDQATNAPWLGTFASCVEIIDEIIQNPGDVEAAVGEARECLAELSQWVCVWGSDWVQVDHSKVSRAIFTQVNSINQVEGASVVVGVTAGKMATTWAREITADASSTCTGRNMLGGELVWQSQELDSRRFVNWLKDYDPED